MQDKNMYELTFSNKGGLVMPIIIEWTYKDGTKEIERIPAQVWRQNENKVVKTFIKNKEVASINWIRYRKLLILMKITTAGIPFRNHPSSPSLNKDREVDEEAAEAKMATRCRKPKRIRKDFKSFTYKKPP